MRWWSLCGVLALCVLPIRADARAVAFVANGAKTVSSIDLATSQILATVPVGNFPVGMAANPAGTTIYVANGYDDTVSVIDTIANTVVTTIPVQKFPVAVAVNPAGTFVYVTNSSSDTVSVIATSSNLIVATIPVSHGPQGIAVHPNGKWVYSYATNDQLMSIIDADRNVVTDTKIVGTHPLYSVFNEDASMLLISTGAGITLFDLSQNAVARTIPISELGAKQLGQIVLDAPNRSIYVLAYTDDDAHTDLLVLDRQSFAITKRIKLGKWSDQAALSPDGRSLYIPSQGTDSVAVVDTATQAVAGSIAVPSGPRPIAMADVPGASPLASVVEYHHAAFDHYFITPVAAEIALLDAHAPPNQDWSRTGVTFSVYANAYSPAGAVAVCRFFNDHFAPKSSHFYAPKGGVCEATLAAFPDWRLEDDKLFNAKMPDAAGVCPAGTVPLYRLYNQGMGGAPNHRFVPSLADRQAMLDKGYVAEGAGIGVGMCVPQ